MSLEWRLVAQPAQALDPREFDDLCLVQSPGHARYDLEASVSSP